MLEKLVRKAFNNTVRGRLLFIQYESSNIASIHVFFNFDLDYNFHENICVGNRIKPNHKVFDSFYYSRLGENGSDYVIKYLKDETIYSYAFISYFIQVESSFLLAVYGLGGNMKLDINTLILLDRHFYSIINLKT